ncbi:MAG: alanine racemase [Pseudomonadota bacterium]
MPAGANAASTRLAGMRVTIDLEALVSNWRALHAMTPGAEPGATVKANAYGCGLEQVGAALAAAGCKSFFVALPEEGISLRRALGAAPDIYVLGGLMGGADIAMVFLENALTPVISSMNDMQVWLEGLRKRGQHAPSALHVDTGMNRLGVSMAEHAALMEDTSTLQMLNPTLVMSHLACADEAGHPHNAMQLSRFQDITKAMPKTRASFANSGAHFLGADYAFDLTRPGIALYGGECQAAGVNPMQPVVTANARVLTIRHMKAGEAIGYGASHRFHAPAAVAIIAAGYADGYHRAGSGGGVPLRGAEPEGAKVRYGRHLVPVVGRVSMDLTAINISAVPEGERTEDWVQLFGPDLLVDDAARAAGTIGYEMLTSLSPRAAYTYITPSESN